MKVYIAKICLAVMIGLSVLSSSSVLAQDLSVNPGINESFRDPNVSQYVERFEKEGREVYDQREKIIAATEVKPGMVIADIGAGTGLFTRLFSQAVGNQGRVYAVDIARSFVNRLVLEARANNIQNIIGVICDDRSCLLPPASIDMAYICDTYHHFEFPQKTLATIHSALRKDGRLIVVDFKREEGESSDWILSHVRAGKSVFQKEIEDAGFQLVREADFLKENYMLIFKRVEMSDAAPDKTPTVEK